MRERGLVIYLDNHSVSKPCASALERMQPFLTDHWGLASSAYPQMASLESKYQILYDFFGASLDDTCVFTSSGAEAVNQILWSIFWQKAKQEGKCHFITSDLEDAPTMRMMQRLEDLGCFVKIARTKPSGELDLEHLSSLVGPRTAAISITMADGLTGVLQPVEAIAALCREKNVLLHLDAAYAAGKIPLCFSDLGADYLSFSGDLIHGLKSSGVFFVKKGSPLSPLIVGGAQQAGLRGGSFDIPSFAALSAAAHQSQLFIDRLSLETVRLRDLLEEGILRRCPLAKSIFIDQLRLPNVSTIAFAGVHSEALLYFLQKKGVFATAGGSALPSLSRLLGSMGFEGKLSESALSFALSRYTTEAEILSAIDLIAASVHNLQSLSERLFS